MKYFDTFTGIGGFTKAIQDIIPSAKCVGYSEIDKYATQIYEKHYPDHKNYGDITKINTATLPDFDLLVGGFPCQAFSVAGKRKGFEDTRGTLFFDLARILKDKRPRHFIFENVKGLLSHDGGKTLQTIFRVLSDIGYEYQWQVLNSKNFGVPQNRERIFIIGHLRGERRPEVFPIRGASEATLEYVGGIVSEKNKMWLEDGKNNSRSFPQGQRVYKDTGVSVTLQAQAGGLGAKTGLYFIDLSTQQAKIRRLTPTECERLQGFPEGWTEKGVDINDREVNISDTQRYRSLGNAVTVNVINEIFINLGLINDN